MYHVWYEHVYLYIHIFAHTYIFIWLYDMSKLLSWDMYCKLLTNNLKLFFFQDIATIIMNCTNLNRVGIESISVGGKNHLSLLQIHKKILQDQLSMLASCIAKCYAAQSRSLENMADSGKMRFVHQQKVGYFPCTVRKYRRSGSLPKCTACSYDSISFIINPTSTKYPNR